jgi:large subunit ribosomal protein L44e
MFKLPSGWDVILNLPKQIKRFCPKCNTHTTQKMTQYKAGKRRGSAIGERRHAKDKKGYGGQKFPKLAKPAKTTKKFTAILTCSVCKKKWNKDGIRIRKIELVAK